jgi:hypothetical protein
MGVENETRKFQMGVLRKNNIPYGQNTRNCFDGIVYASASETCIARPLPAELGTSHLSSHVIIGVLHRQVFCVSYVVQLCVGGDEDELADSTGRQLSMDD